MLYKNINLLLVEDHDSVSLGVMSSLEKSADFTFEITVATTADKALHNISQNQYDIVLLDLILKDESSNSLLSGGEDVLRELNKMEFAPKVIVMSKIDSLDMLDYVINVLDTDAYILKSRTSLQEIIPAIHSVLSNEHFYSQSIKKLLRYHENLLEMDIIDRIILKSLSNGLKYIGIESLLKEKSLHITVSAIEKRVKKLKIRFDANTNAQLVAMAIKEGII